MTKHESNQRISASNSALFRDNKLKKFINEFFVKRTWDNLPEGFPYCDTTGLTIMEKDLFNAIVFVWTTTEKGRKIFYKNIIHTVAVSTVVLFIIFLGLTVLTKSGKVVAESVNAATISATLKRGGDILESTASAILGK